MSLVTSFPNGLSDFSHAEPIEQGEKSVSPMLVFSILRRRKFSVLFVGLLFSAAAIGAVSMVPPSYVSTASVLMQERKPIVADFQSPTGTIATDSVAVRTQADVLRSADLARNVVRKLGLADRPEFAPATAPSLLARTVDLLRPYDREGLIERTGLFAPPVPATAAERLEIATQTLLNMTTIVNDGRSYVIDIKVKVTANSGAEAGRAAALSAELANAYADAYSQFTGKVKSDSMRQANVFFDERTSALQQKMRAAEQAVQNYRSETGLIEDRAVGGNGRPVTIASQQMAQLNSDLIVAGSDRASKEASLQQINLARSGRGDLAAVSEVVASPLIQLLRNRQAELGAREAALATSHGENSPELVAVRGSQRDTAAQIAAETAKIGASLRTAVESARGRETALRASLAKLQTEVGAQGKSEVKLRELQNEADIAQLIYSTYLKRAQETSNQIDMQEPDALIVSHSGVPLSPAPPSKRALGAAGVVIAFFLAGLLALIRERMQSGFRTAQQLEAGIGIPTLGFLPKVRNLRAALGFANRESSFSQAVFSIRALLRLSMGGGSQVVMVTSALPQEGKTFFTSSLARNAALAGERVLLIDCDLRRPAVARTTAATDSDELDGVTIRRDTHSSLDIITLTTGHASPQDLFASAQMRNMIAMLRERYELIMLDTPPVLAASDARVLSVLADLTVLVVCWQKTPQALVSNAVQALRSSGAKLAGVVVTQVRLNDLSPADGGYVYAYSSRSKFRLA